ncbi:hypothetical protein CEXT_444491 [Caerostris extrusa]|uniref:Uncharacterized protein n=1 Tax=Caerostris extrusa TaxID=172846 RepID=A0AAV4U3S4_CAEEX|nr:hypothetical protein CEXT_444491 [Caerostris extrusa]
MPHRKLITLDQITPRGMEWGCVDITCKLTRDPGPAKNLSIPPPLFWSVSTGARKCDAKIASAGGRTQPPLLKPFPAMSYIKLPNAGRLMSGCCSARILLSRVKIINPTTFSEPIGLKKKEKVVQKTEEERKVAKSRPGVLSPLQQLLRFCCNGLNNASPTFQPCKFDTISQLLSSNNIIIFAICAILVNNTKLG